MFNMSEKENIGKNIDKNVNITWVQDAHSADVDKTIYNLNTKYMKRPKDSRYIKGLPKNNKTEYAGIYFEDPIITG